ncbi:MAG: heat-inducible transcriptional repressor HrcA [Dehalococcoidia bacterium]|nr:heat-inducible transcriptional repressor HrcA [Dehalococcoidia bacterium]
MLTERRGRILQSLIQEYISSAVPVSSEIIARKCGLRVSSATVRNELVRLEEEGYIVQPHTSAGRIPTAKGYRYYVEVLLEERELPQQEQRQILHQFYQTGKEVEEWIQLAAAILARMVNSVAIVTPPQLMEPRLKLVEMVSLREFLALLLLVFDDASFRQRKVSFDTSMTQEDLNVISRRLTGSCGGLTRAEIRTKEEELSLTDAWATQALLGLMDEVSQSGAGEPHFDGVSHILSQPEFTKSERAQLLMELLEGRSLLNSILRQAPGDERLRVIIGGEGPETALRGFSVVLSRYGLPRQASGVIGVVGPTRMPYDRAFSALRFLSGTMSELLHEEYR